MQVKIFEWRGADPPSREAQLTVRKDYSEYYALWEPGYCGCEDCSPIVGYGPSEPEAIENYWFRWSERYE
jgi:hypothetical protein